MTAGPFTTGRIVQRQAPRYHQLFAHQNTQHTMLQLQARGMEVINTQRQNRLIYHKPLPLPENKFALEKIVHPKHSWEGYCHAFRQIPLVAFTPTHFNAVLASLLYAVQLKAKLNIEPIRLVPSVAIPSIPEHTATVATVLPVTEQAGNSLQCFQ